MSAHGTCPATDRIVEWEECHVDHRTPLTFSVIVRSFIVARGIETSSVAYEDSGARERFANHELAVAFELFHREMAVLRIVAADQNAKLSSGARNKPTKKDRTLRGDRSGRT